MWVNPCLLHTLPHHTTSVYPSDISLHSNQYGCRVPIDTYSLLCSQLSAGRLTRSEGVGWPLLLQRLPPSPAPPWAPLLLSSPYPWGEYSVGWMAPDRGLRGWNFSLALQGSDPPEHWSTAQSLLINHCQGCPGPGPYTTASPAPFLLLSLPLVPPIHTPKCSYMHLFLTTYTN